MGPERTCKPAEIKALKVDGECSEDAPPVIRKILKRGIEADPIHGLFETAIGGEPAVVESEPDSGLRDTEQIPLATLNGADILASWNFKHMVNLRRIRSYNEVNIERGHDSIDIRTPQDVAVDSQWARKIVRLCRVHEGGVVPAQPEDEFHERRRVSPLAAPWRVFRPTTRETCGTGAPGGKEAGIAIASFFATVGCGRLRLDDMDTGR